MALNNLTFKWSTQACIDFKLGNDIMELVLSKEIEFGEVYEKTIHGFR
jgi:hypothetical protein